MSEAEKPAPPREGWEPVELPSGRSARVMRAKKGKHLDLASRVAGPAPSQMRFGMAMASVVCLVDDRELQIEDLEEMDHADVFALIGAALGSAAGKVPGSSPDAT